MEQAAQSDHNHCSRVYLGKGGRRGAKKLILLTGRGAFQAVSTLIRVKRNPHRVKMA